MSIKESDLQIMPLKNGFRLRGNAMTRLEAFSDAAFAFAMTMLVISVGNIPGSYQELIEALKGVPTFAASFASIMAFWIGHRTWSQRYGMEDGVSTFFSLLLIFVVLVYLYPLKIVFSAFFTFLSAGWLPTEFRILSNSEITGVFIIYGIGLAILSGCLALLNLRALKFKSELKLNEEEELRTVAVIASWTVMALTGLVSFLFAWLMPEPVNDYSGFVYFSLAITMPATSIYFNKKITR